MITRPLYELFFAAHRLHSDEPHCQALAMSEGLIHSGRSPFATELTNPDYPGTWLLLPQVGVGTYRFMQSTGFGLELQTETLDGWTISHPFKADTGFYEPDENGEPPEPPVPPEPIPFELLGIAGVINEEGGHTVPGGEVIYVLGNELLMDKVNTILYDDVPGAYYGVTPEAPGGGGHYGAVGIVDYGDPGVIRIAIDHQDYGIVACGTIERVVP